MARFVARLSASAFGAGLFGIGAATLDAWWSGKVVSEPAPLAKSAWADAGLIAPLSLAIGLAVGVLSFFLHSGAAPSPRRLALALRDPDRERRAYLAAFAPLSALGTALFIVVDAKATLSFFAGSSRAQVVGLAVGLTTCVAALIIALMVTAGARALARVFREPPDPLATGSLGLVLAVALIAAAVAAGETSGAGGFLALFGVLKRPELDLRAPGLLAWVALGAYLVPALLARLPSSVLFAASLLPLALTVRSARTALDERKVALALERGAPLGKIALRVERKLTDRDKDGFAGKFGGGDCDDRDPAVNPRAEDTPGNGRDEDCSGRDDMAVSLKASQASVAPALPAEARHKLPEDLSVLLITIDTLRYDLGYAGNARPISPNLDRLAQRSVVYDNAYSLASYTSKSLPPFMIGKYPSETHRGFSHFNRFTEQDTFVQQRLQKAGIRTLSVQGYWYFFNPGVGFERGFDVVNSSAAPKHVQVEGDRTANSDKISDAALAELAEPHNTAKRFFCWIHYIDPHTEYVQHPEFDFGSGSRERYDSEVAFVDKHVGRVLDYLEQSGLARRTAVIVTADHGEAFGEHGMIRHGFELWEELVHVPLVVHIPGVPARHVKERRGAIDLVPTMLELLDVPKPSGEGSDFVSGQSLLPELLAPAGLEPKSKIVFVDMPAGPNNAERQAFIEDDLKLITTDARPLGLYNLKTDPGEKQDLLDDAELVGKVQSRFKAFRRELREVTTKPTR